MEFPARNGDAIAVATVLPSQARLAVGQDLPYASRGRTPSSGLQIPYVIDNQNHHMAEVLGAILAGHTGKSPGCSHGLFQRAGLYSAPTGPARIGQLSPVAWGGTTRWRGCGSAPRAASRLIRELNGAPFDEATLRAAEDLIAFLRRDLVAVRAYQKGFLHAKSYIFYGDLPIGGEDRFQPIAAIVGFKQSYGSWPDHEQRTKPLP